MSYHNNKPGAAPQVQQMKRIQFVLGKDQEQVGGSSSSTSLPSSSSSASSATSIMGTGRAPEILFERRMHMGNVLFKKGDFSSIVNISDAERAQHA